MTSKKIISWTVGLAAVGGLAAWLGVSHFADRATASAPVPMYQPRVRVAEVDVAVVEPRALSSELEFTGNLLPRRVTRVSAEVEGVVREISQSGPRIEVEVAGRRYSEQLGLTYGSPVHAGEVLLQLDARDAEAAARMAAAKLQKAQADLDKLKAWERPEEVQRLAALREDARARHEQGLANFRRTESLVRSKVLTAADYEAASMEAATSKAALDAAEAALRTAQAGPTAEDIAVHQALIAQAEAEVEQHRRRLEKSAIRAPYDGVLTGLHVEVGDWVSPASGAVAEVMDVRYLVAEFAVPEAYVGRVRVEDRAEVQAAGLVEPVPGLVVAVNDSVDVQTRTFAVRVAVDNDDRRLKAGQFARVRLNLGTSQPESLAAPTESIVFVEGRPHVFVVEGDEVRCQPVTLGIRNPAATEILSGLQPGEWVVRHDPSLLADGMRVAVRDRPPTEAIEVAGSLR